MAILTGPEILRQKGMGKIVINPFNEKQLNPNSYNLTLNNKLVTYDFSPYEDVLDIKKSNPTKELFIPEEGFILWPDRLYLGSTKEYTETFGYVPFIEGRSSMARLGINVHQTAGFGDCAFRGTWTLEITVVHPVKIYPDIQICQIGYLETVGEQVAYKGRYNDQIEATASRLYKDYI